MNASAEEPTPILMKQADPRPDSPGRVLMEARELRRLEIPRVAGELRLRPEVLESIEQDDYAALPSPVFVAGYMRAYARLLDLDPEPLLARFRELHPAAEAPPPRIAPRPRTEPGSGGGFLRLVSLLIVMALIGGSYLWWSGQRGMSAPDRLASDGGSAPGGPDAAFAPPPQGADTSEPPLADPVPVDWAPPPDEPAEDSLPAEAAAIAPPAEDLLPTPEPPTTDPATLQPGAADTGLTTDEFAAGGEEFTSPTAEPQAADAPAATDAESPAAAGSASDEISIAFSGPCWVDIRDASGKFKLFGEMGNGDRHVLDGEPPFSLILGNASVVDMRVGDRPVDVRAIAKGNVARFEFDPAELRETESAD